MLDRYERLNQMKFEILNVQHGFAAYAIAQDGSVLLFDCGHFDLSAI